MNINKRERKKRKEMKDKGVRTMTVCLQRTAYPKYKPRKRSRSKKDSKGHPNYHGCMIPTEGMKTTTTLSYPKDCPTSETLASSIVYFSFYTGLSNSEKC